MEDEEHDGSKGENVEEHTLDRVSAGPAKAFGLVCRMLGVRGGEEMIMSESHLGNGAQCRLGGSNAKETCAKRISRESSSKKRPGLTGVMQ